MIEQSPMQMRVKQLTANRVTGSTIINCTTIIDHVGTVELTKQLWDEDTVHLEYGIPDENASYRLIAYGGEEHLDQATNLIEQYKQSQVLHVVCLERISPQGTWIEVWGPTDDPITEFTWE